MKDFKRFTDEELVQLYRNGSDQAFTELYVRYERKLKRLIFYYIPNTDEADDVFHDTVMRVFRHIDTFNVKRSFSSWIYQIAVNCSKNYIGRHRRESRLLDEERYRLSGEYHQSLSPEDICISNNDLEEFNRAIEQLKERFRIVFVLRHDHKLKYAEIAGVLKCSERTVKWRMEKALEKIAQYLSEKGII
ncbi:MAG: hypothetical protein A2176_07065 [Spirochaetes bacterium RBG_13_51_14]|nr:MAG: hypothetical protein A2176_07065 [Spirochaetes bacterium RBG_13_51_14]